MDRRELMGRIGAVSVVLATAGCLDDGGDDGSPDSVDSSPSVSPNGDTDTESSDDSTEAEETCYTETSTETERVLSTSRRVDGGYEWTHEYRVEDDDRVSFDISASAGQDVRVEIDSPRGQTVYSESGLSLNTVHTFHTGGSGEVRVANLGERTEEEREELWDDRIDVSAGGTIDMWAEIREGNHVDYYVRMASGARPILRIEDERGNVMREHSVAEVIDDTFTAPDDGRYYFIMENTAWMTAGTWDYSFERVNEVSVPTSVDLSVEREFEVESEVCE